MEISIGCQWLLANYCAVAAHRRLLVKCFDAAELRWLLARCFVIAGNQWSLANCCDVAEHQWLVARCCVIAGNQWFLANCCDVAEHQWLVARCCNIAAYRQLLTCLRSTQPIDTIKLHVSVRWDSIACTPLRYAFQYDRYLTQARMRSHLLY